MNTTKSLFLVNVVGGSLFTLVFWNEKMGINTAIFCLFICATVFAVFPFAAKNKFVRWLFASKLLALAMVVINNTLLSKIVFAISSLCFVIFSQYPHQSILFAGGSAAVNVLHYLPNFFKSFGDLFASGMGVSKLVSQLRLLFIPLLLFILFYALYASGNAVFADITNNIGQYLENVWDKLSDCYNGEAAGFFLLGLLVTGIVIFRSKTDYFSQVDMRMKEALQRKRDALKKWQRGPFSDFAHILVGKSAAGNYALKIEFRIGLISLWLLNILILVANLLDLRYVWAGVPYTKGYELSKYVHEGAGLLIFSIILAIAILLFFFRGNLNFYTKNKWLKVGAYVWIIQNAVLALSVFQRNYYYISKLGLAYKRVALVFFLALVLCGLVSTYIKIVRRRTTYFLLKINSWALLILLVLASLVDWDLTIAEYNLSRKNEIPQDAQFLLSLSDNVLPLLEENQDVLLTDRHTSFYKDAINYDGTATDFLDLRADIFLKQQQHYSWLSWNKRDADTFKKMKGEEYRISSK